MERHVHAAPPLVVLPFIFYQPTPPVASVPQPRASGPVERLGRLTVREAHPVWLGNPSHPCLP